jgi:hypothetical protein
MAVRKTEQYLSIDGSRYLQLATAIHTRILLRHDFGGHDLTGIAAR